MAVSRTRPSRKVDANGAKPADAARRESRTSRQHETAGGKFAPTDPLGQGIVDYLSMTNSPTGAVGDCGQGFR
jgi:hypothetical protein